MAETTFKKATEIEERVKALEEFEKTLTPEQKAFRDKFRIEVRSKRTMDPKRRKELEAKLGRKPKGDCADGEHCQKIVDEENFRISVRRLESHCGVTEREDSHRSIASFFLHRGNIQLLRANIHELGDPRLFG